MKNNRNSSIISITGTVLSLGAFIARKALVDKETREKIVDTFLGIKKKLSESKKDTMRQNWEKTNLKKQPQLIS